MQQGDNLILLILIQSQHPQALLTLGFCIAVLQSQTTLATGSTGLHGNLCRLISSFLSPCYVQFFTHTIYSIFNQSSPEHVSRALRLHAAVCLSTTFTYVYQSSCAHEQKACSSLSTLVGAVDRRGQHKRTICDALGPCQRNDAKTGEQSEIHTIRTFRTS